MDKKDTTEAPAAMRDNDTPDAMRGDGMRGDAIISTICPHLGRPCPAATRMLQALTRAGRAARRLTPDLEMTGTSRLDGCPRQCPAVYRLSPAGAAVFCGVTDATEAEALDRFAARFLDGDETRSLLSDDAAPLAFALSPVSPRPVAGPQVARLN